MQRIITALATFAAFLAVIVVPSAVLTSSAEAAAAGRTPGCITKAEYRKIKRKMPIKKVRRVVGARGKITSSSDYSDGDGYRSVDFRQCGKSWSMSSVSISFEKTERRVWNSYWGWWDTKYVKPFIVTSKYAYWF